MFWKIAIVKIWREFQGKNLFCISFLVNQVSTADIFWEFVQILKTPAASIGYNDMKYSYFCTAIFVSKREWKHLIGVVLRKDALLNFEKLTEKHLYRSLFFQNNCRLKVFPCEFCKIFKNTIFVKHLRMTAFGKVKQWRKSMKMKNETFQS